MLRASQLNSLRITPALPVILQRHPLQCGIACISMLCSYYGYPTPLSLLEKKYGLNLSAVSISGILQIFNDLGHHSVAVNASIDELRSLRDPCIVHLKPGHFAVLRRLTEARAYLHDPLVGNVRIDAAHFQKAFEGYAIAIFPTESKLPLSPSLISLIFEP